MACLHQRFVVNKPFIVSHQISGFFCLACFVLGTLIGPALAWNCLGPHGLIAPSSMPFSDTSLSILVWAVSKASEFGGIATNKTHGQTSPDKDT